ncbi:unnamed protein product [Dibothriocephalus latus]|uniref:Uncharacterized protein n=1 Tax=Dibothriocephalus latus TaxID=60516 RepID=A0A3P7LPL2_DIBLA|nr:unnamed protein product [Dibothriocephalus latus]
MSTLSTTSKTLLSASLFPDIAAETLITSLCFLARLQPDALDSWQSYFGDWVVFRPLLLSSTSIGEEVLSTLVFFLYSSCKAGGAENSRLIIFVLSNLVRLFTPTEEDCDEKVVHLASVFVSFLTLSGEDSENPNLLSLATGSVPTNIALSFVWTCIISLAGASQLPKEPMWTLANVYVHLYERASTDVWKINPSPLPLSEQLYEQLSCVVEQNLIACATSVPVWHSFQQIRLIFELFTAFTSLVTGLSDNKILEDACKVAAVLRDLFSSEQFEAPPIRDKWLRQVPLIMSAFVDCLTRPDPTLCGGFSVGFAPLKRNLISSLVDTTLLLIRCTLELVDRLSQQSVNEFSAFPPPLF